jgi:hypothetical protein
MQILWSTTFRSFGINKFNDKIQYKFLKSIKQSKFKIHLSITQFDDANVFKNIKKYKIKFSYLNFSKKKLPRNKKYSSQIMLMNSLKYYLKNYNEYKYFIYSTADIKLPEKLFNYLEKNKENNILYLIFPNTLIKNNQSSIIPYPYFGIDLFIFKIDKTNVEIFQRLISNWKQYDWGINDNFLVSVADYLNLNIINLYKNFNILKYENPFAAFNESRSWQVKSWNENVKYYYKFLKKFKISLLYYYGSFYYLAFKIFRIKDLNTKLLISYCILFYLFFKNLVIKFFFVFLDIMKIKNKF